MSSFWYAVSASPWLLAMSGSFVVGLGVVVFALTASPLVPESSTPGPRLVLPSPRRESDPLPPGRPVVPVPRAAFRPDIEGLRALAVLLVVLYHADVPFLTGGYVGVDVFFVISGFLITGHLVRELAVTGRVSLRAFYASRMRRLLPPAVIVVVATVLAARAWSAPAQVRSISWDAIFTTFYGLNYRLAAGGVDYQQAEGPESPLQHFWSLAVEEQFYVLWPLVIVACVAVFGRSARRVLPVALIALSGLSFAAAVTITASNAPLAYFALHTRAWELGAGCLLALAAAMIAKVPVPVTSVASWVGLGMICWSAFSYDSTTPFPGTAATVPVLGAVLVIAAGCRPGRGSALPVLTCRPAQFLGGTSYSWYLWHWPALVLVPLALGRELAWWYQLVVLLGALVLASWTRSVVELPARYSRLPTAVWLRVGGWLSAGTAAAAAAVLVTMPATLGSGAALMALPLDGQGTAGVQRAITAAAALRDVPRNLTPSLDTAHADVAVTSRDGCHLDYAEVAQPDCVYGDPGGTRTVVLYGDSHAQQWLPGLDETAQRLGWRVVAWTKAACSLADGDVWLPVLQRDFTECYAWRSDREAAIQALRPDLVLVSQSDTVPASRSSNEEWAQGTRAAVVRLAQSGLQVRYLLDTPYHEEGSVPDCVAQHLSDAQACSLSEQDAWPYDDRRAELGHELSEAGISVVDTGPWFCAEGRCPAIVGNLLVYRDASHMSARYSAWLAPALEPLLR